MRIQCKQVETIQEFIDGMRIQVQAFIIEQGTPPGYDPDELDKSSQHFIALVDSRIVGMVRLREEPKHHGKIEHLVILKEYRKKGIGTKLLTYTVKQAQKQQMRSIWLQAQVSCLSMFEKARFYISSVPYDLYNLGIAHVDMYYDPKKSSQLR